MRAHKSVNAQGPQDDSIMECRCTLHLRGQIVTRRAQAKKIRQRTTPFRPPEPHSSLTKTVEHPATSVMRNAVLRLSVAMKDAIALPLHPASCRQAIKYHPNQGS